MCLTLKKSRTDIAKRNIVCWKVVNPIEDVVPLQWLPKQISYTGAYEFNKVCRARKNEGSGVITLDKWTLREIDCLEIKHQEGFLIIEEGFHAYRTYKKAKSSGLDFYPCIIPRGSEYGLGVYDDIVSTRIIVFSSFIKFLKYLLLPWMR